jgi:hypothetical protein
MNEKSVEDLERQALGPFRKSFTKRYEQWKRADLLSIAVETMPKQVKRDAVLYDLVKLKIQREKDMNQQT